MPKGDRLRLKADPEDGTTPIANLLLDAVAIAKLSGLHKGAILHLWRVTYGWTDDNGKRRKEAKIGLSEWARSLDSTNPRASVTLTELVEKNIIFRRVADVWGGYYYRLNTNIADWNSGSVNIAKLKEVAGIPNFSDITKNTTITNNNTITENVTVTRKDTIIETGNITVTENVTEQLPKTQPPTLYKESTKEIINKEVDANIPENLHNVFPLKDTEKIKVLKISDDSITASVIKKQRGELVAEVFARLDQIRGYRPPKRNAEAASIIRMLKTYTPNQIIETWQSLKQDRFWLSKELYMMNVESQIGAMINGKHQTNSNEDGETNNKFTDGKYGHLVKK